MNPCPLKAGIGATKKRMTPGIVTDPDVVRFAAWISVWGRWFIWFVGLSQTVYRPSLWYPEDVEYLVMFILVFTVNGIVHHRLLTNRAVTLRWLLLLSAVDVTVITFGVVIGGGLPSYIFVAYYPALAILAIVFSSILLSVAWTTTVGVIYLLVCLVSGSGLDLEAGEEKVLFSRLAMMYAIVIGIGLISRFERIRWQAAVSRERWMRRERVELSQRIHDTTAQTAYMIGLGIHRIRKLAGESNKELTAALEATYALSRTAMWEMRGPIDEGQIVDGRELGRVLWTHCATFEKITAIPTEMSQSGEERPLAAAVRTGLYAIAHNALTNAFLHAEASKVQVHLSFETDRIRLSVSDNGVGLPNDYADRGRGFLGMEADAERMGGVLTVENVGGQGGTCVTCVVPLHNDDGGS